MMKLTSFVFLALLFFSCKPLSRSIEETLSTDSASVKQKPAASPADRDAMGFTKAESSAITKIVSSSISIITSHTAKHSLRHMEQKSTGFLTDTIRLLRAERALKKLPRYVGKKMYIYSTISFFDDGRIFIMLQHPSNPKYVDNYQYGNGKWSAAGPQQLSVMDDVQGRLTPLTKLKFVYVTRVARVYNQKAMEIEGAEPLSNTYISIWKNEIRWFPVSISGSRERYAIGFNAEGILERFGRE